jgi:hypothetical protein
MYAYPSGRPGGMLGRMVRVGLEIQGINDAELSAYRTLVIRLEFLTN